MRCPDCNSRITIVSGHEVCTGCLAYRQHFVTAVDTGHVYKRERESQIHKDFSSYALPDCIRNSASAIYIEVTEGDTLKRGRRKAMMSKCAYEALKNADIPRDPIMLAKMFDINVQKLRDAQCDFHKRIHALGLKRKYPKKHWTSQDLLPEFLLLLDISDPPINDLSIIISSLYAASTSIQRIRPRDIAIAVAYWFKNKYCTKLSEKEVSEKTFIAKATLHKVVNIIQIFLLI